MLLFVIDEAIVNVYFLNVYFMNVYFVPAECRQTELGCQYMGTMSTTVNGRTCQAWASNTPHVPNSAAQNDANYLDGSREAAMNYCRNPDSYPGGPWCYTTDPEVRWEACNVPYCGTSNNYSTLSILIVVCRINNYANLETVTNNVHHCQ